MLKFIYVIITRHSCHTFPIKIIEAKALVILYTKASVTLKRVLQAQVQLHGY